MAQTSHLQLGVEEYLQRLRVTRLHQQQRQLLKGRLAPHNAAVVRPCCLEIARCCCVSTHALVHNVALRGACRQLQRIGVVLQARAAAAAGGVPQLLEKLLVRISDGDSEQ